MLFTSSSSERGTPNSRVKKLRAKWLLSLLHRQPQKSGSSLDFEFLRECTKINKIRPKFYYSTKIEIKMTYLVFVFCYYCLFASRAIWKPFYRRLIFWVVLTVRKMGRLGTLKLTVPARSSKLAKIAVKGSVDNLSFPSMLLESQISSQPLAKRLILTFFHQSFLSRDAYDRASGRDVINGRSQLTSQRQSASVRGGGAQSIASFIRRVPGSIWPGRKKLGRWNEWGRAI